MVVGIVTDVLEMLVDGAADLHTLQTEAQFITQDLGVVAGTAGGAKAGHGDSHHAFGAFAQQLHGLGGHQQGQGRVQTARNTDDGGGGVDMAQTAGQTLALQGENVGAVLIPGGFIGKERILGNDTGQRGFGEFHGEIYCEGLFAGRIAVELAAIGHQTLHVDLRQHISRLGKGFAFGQERAILGDEMMAGVHHVGGAFVRTGIAQHISAMAAAALGLHQLADGSGMTGGVMAGALVDYDGSAVAAHFHGRGNRHPKILANLYTKGEIGKLLTAEQHTGAKGHQIAAQLNGGQVLGGGLEPAQLAKLVIVGQIGFGHHAEDLTFVEHCGTVVKLAQMAKGDTGHQNQRQRGGVLHKLLQGLQSAVLQTLLEEQISAAVTGDGKLRGDQKMHAVLGGSLCRFGNAGCVIGAVGKTHGRRHRGNLNKTVFHNSVSFWKDSYNFIITFSRQNARTSGRNLNVML